MGTPLKESTLADLAQRLPTLTLRDERKLGRRLEGVRKVRKPAARQAVIEQIAAEITAAELKVDARRAGLPEITYPAELPVSQRRDDILAAVRDHQVVIVAGETGSGKTTQLPKICLELGRGVRGTIGHTQPRRLAARTVAERIAEELDIPLGEAIGYKVRFNDQISDSTLVKLMTDGILLAEIQSDRLLSQYDTLIIDEAHERSLNIDFILGYIKQLLPKRPDLKVIITSATIDPERFSRHFGDAPIVEVSGRTYPVEVRYRPIIDPDDPNADEDRDQTQAILDAVDELAAEGPGDVLVFLSGEREIRDTAEAVSKHAATKQELKNTEILPLYARLSFAEQHRVFQSHRGRRIVLATNVAETSLTVPGIKYVIDPGTARISRYSNRLKVQRLPIEAVSQASANQRKGRCGRVSEGICIRLYTEDEFDARPEFTDPEILRTNLASVILQMTAAGLGEMAEFPFIDPPDKRNIADGVNLLQELGALEKGALTSLGRKLAQLPVDPRLARMVLAADGNGCVHEVMVIAAALSIQDPRERPQDKQEQAQQAHARFADKTSDFLSYLNLWEYLRTKQKELSGNRFRKLCKAEFLNYLRVREWQDIYSQLRQVMDVKPKPAEGEIDSVRVHQSVLSGLLSHIGLRDQQKQDYIGARGARFAVFPGSALFKKPPQWVMAAELVETSRLWGRIAARIEPAWVEPLATHLVKRTYSEPHWERKQGAVMATERVTLYGIPIVTNRKVNYGRIDPELSREMFIRSALVEGDWETRHKFFHANRKLLTEVEELENRARRRDLLVDDETLFDFYDKRIGAEVVSGRHFDTWWKKTSREQPDLLTFPTEMLLNANAQSVTPEAFPDNWDRGGLTMRLSYQFEPGRKDDGVTAHIPLPVLNQVTADGFAWQVPGLREEIITALLKSLPKQVRRNFVPAPDWAKAILHRIPDLKDESLLDAVEREIKALSGIAVAREDWDLTKIPDHLRVTYRVEDERRTLLAEGKDLGDLKRKLQPKMRETLSSAAGEIERKGLRTWEIGTLPKMLRQEQHGFVVTAYPALVDAGTSVDVRMFETEAEQRDSMWKGTRRLLLLNTASPLKYVLGRMSNTAKLALSANPHRDMQDFFDDCIACAVDKLVSDGGGVAWDAAAFKALQDRVRTHLNPTVLEVVTQVGSALAAYNSVQTRLSGMGGPRLEPSLQDIRQQLSRLVYRGFVTASGYEQLPSLTRYLRGIELRLDKLPERPDRDLEWAQSAQDVWQAYRELPDSPEARRIRWMIEELRLSYFAQSIKTAYAVSEKRIYRAIDQLM
ncbi:ATP-dependent RNA helicase HrpA [Kibdelosporangium philippinense]|uniref:ATP-dependent RNA helicase HrpA n=1 Tax=Kibdelosporangium philippinense TaxID=211113 RepID=A0ABS8ZIQ3_9PSEU|nr:ATP-dependent RNA helicase HrpA [Kibdelosporangium philippinense]MCE7007664.1 ATP-dependent RNA helicase HrpA [Kibdelosporangium philippinense]